MAPEDKQTTPEREQTDESLRHEREKADDALEAKLAAIEETADAVITKARDRADEVLAESRASSDRQTRSSQVRSAHGVQKERALEDEALREERADADEVVRVERAERLALLAIERGETDKDLSTERSGADEALAARDEFLGVVSHELRNMLHGMVGFAALIAEAELRPNHSADVVAYAQRIQRSGARMSRLIGDLVDVASIAAGSFPMTRVLADAEPVVVEAVDSFETQASANGITLLSEPAPASALAEFDPARILQVLTNLLSNAIKFTPRDGKVSVRLERTASGLRMAVSDTGAGIPEDKLEAVFGRFHQLDANDRRGVGLGLYISKCIVEAHGGKIWAESRLGEGSTFHVTLPAAVATGARDTADS
ncbi:MAG TPA: ATP-binding protein [Polyangiaceae bacterium]